jgi:hypothetical protein
MKERKYVQNTAKIRPLKFAENVEKWKSPRKQHQNKGETIPPSFVTIVSSTSL